MIGQRPRKILLIEGCDFESFPVGGQLSFARQAIPTMGERIALVGISTDATPVGQWVEISRFGRRMPFFAFAKVNPSHHKPVIPLRIQTYIALKRFRKEILAYGARSVISNSPEVTMAVRNWGLDHLLHIARGTNNPVLFSRYRWARPLAARFERSFFSAIRIADVILANADDSEISNFVNRSRGAITAADVLRFRTYCDTSVFRPGDVVQARATLDLSSNTPVLVTCGRLNWVKGWDLIIESFSHVAKRFPRSMLCLVGDGEDRSRVEEFIERFNLAGSVRLTGNLAPEGVANYLNASDVVLLGSLLEGWPTAIVEAISCGKPVVTTNVSGARQMVLDGRNGFVLNERNPTKFAEAIVHALEMDARSVSLELAQRFSLDRMRADIESVWPPLVAAGES